MGNSYEGLITLQRHGGNARDKWRVRKAWADGMTGQMLAQAEFKDVKAMSARKARSSLPMPSTSTKPAKEPIIMPKKHQIMLQESVVGWDELRARLYTCHNSPLLGGW